MHCSISLVPQLFILTYFLSQVIGCIKFSKKYLLLSLSDSAQYRLNTACLWSSVIVLHWNLQLHYLPFTLRAARSSVVLANSYPLLRTSLRIFFYHFCGCRFLLYPFLGVSFYRPRKKSRCRSYIQVLG